MKSESLGLYLDKVGDALRRIRLNQNLSQQIVADRSGLSLKAVANLESGRGASLRSFLSVCRTLGKMEWLDVLTPPSGPSPMELLQLSGRPERIRASAMKKEA